jgi:signal transduction histidine kinase
MTTTIQMLPFEVTARTVDHLGREQIADSPTAVSELWKNAYDAYATGVGLHVFAGARAVAAILDDGHGMSFEEFADRWLVLGTSVKLTDEVPIGDRNGLSRRERQGQKGIGRLSIAFLGPITVVISKRSSRNFMASAIDWRAFENPFINLGDLITPVAEFEEETALSDVVSQLVEGLADNVWPKERKEPDRKERAKRLRDAWERYSTFEQTSGATVTTEERMAGAALDVNVTDDLLKHWSVWSGRSSHGTALFIFEPKDEIVVSANRAVTGNSDDSTELERNLRATLMGFVDPYSGRSPDFDYGVFTHRAGETSVFLSGDRQFGRADFERLEHSIDGRFDKNGIFVGKITAFGKPHSQVRIAPPWGTLRRATRVGPFDFCLGTFEQEANSSTHTAEEHTHLLEQADRYAGLRIYRDGLRVMPYGRPEADFFRLEERRSKHAGREFWQHRRVFGRVGLSRKDNPHLRDKAGREGLIENTARLQLQNLVIHILKHTARQFFGSDAPARKETIDVVRATRVAAREARDTARRSADRRVLHHIRSKSPQLEEALAQSEVIDERLTQGQFSSAHLTQIDQDIESLVSALETLRLPARAGKLGLHEAKYLEYRTRFRELADRVQALRATLRHRYEEQTGEQVADVVAARLKRARATVVTSLNDVVRSVQTTMAEERLRIEGRAADDRKRLQLAAETLAARVGTGDRMRGLLDEVDATFDSLRTEIVPYYEQYAQTLQRLAEGLRVDLALTSTLYQSAQLEERVSQLNVLAQMGITVEIVGHELERLNDEAQVQFDRLSPDVQSAAPFKRAKRAYDALVSRLRFLGPLKVSGPQLRERISGSEIADYVCEFFAAQFKEREIEFDATDAFRSFTVLDYHYRLLPVFMNLVNNSLYWLQFVERRTIRLDVVNQAVVLSDNGPGVDPDDVESLFELFFTRRSGGRGIGLYLARANLGASGHRIEYQNGAPGLSGANFLIHFRG